MIVGFLVVNSGILLAVMQDEKEEEEGPTSLILTLGDDTHHERNLSLVQCRQFTNKIHLVYFPAFHQCSSLATQVLYVSFSPQSSRTDKKEKKIFLIY